MKKSQWFYGLLVFAGGLAGGIIAGELPHTPLARAAFAAPGAGPALEQRVVTASEFVLADAAGKSRARISVNKQGGAAFAMYGPRGHLRAQILVAADGSPGIHLYGTANKLRIALDVSSDDVPTVRLMDKSGVPRALFGVDTDGEPGLNFYSGDGRLMRQLP
jgi:hypothetical protein